MALPTLNVIELCAGVGMLEEGVSAGFEYLGVDARTVCYVEREAPAAAQLVALMEAGALAPAAIWSDMLTFDSRGLRSAVDGIVAGFPCQDLSIAGRRAGLDGKRSGLFFRVLDIADDSGAWFLVLENVSGIASATASVVDEAEGDLEERAAARVLGELADRGWNAEWITLPASSVGANHERNRWFCIAWRMADTGIPGLPQPEQPVFQGTGRGIEGGAAEQLRGAPLFAPGPSDPIWQGLLNTSRIGAWSRAVTDDEAGACPWAPATKPGVRMLADGLALVVDESRNHQLRQVGNGVVPLQAAYATVVLARRAGILNTINALRKAA